MSSEPTPLRPVRPVTIYRRKPFYLKRRFLLPLLAIFGGGMVLFVALALFLHPFRKQAAEYDLEEMGHLETASIVYDREGREIGRIYVENRKPIRISDVPYHFVQALMAAEDARFFRHKGVDMMGVMRAALANLRSRRTV